MTSNIDTLYRLLVQSVTDFAIYLIDSQGYISNWNAGAEQAKGYKADEIVGRHFSTFYTQEERRKGFPARALRTALTQGRFEGEGWRVRKDGSLFWAHVIIDPVRDDAGDLIGFAKITRDLTEKRAKERKVRDQERSFRLLVQGVTDYAIYMLDTEGRVSNWNAGAERAKGYRESEIVGEHFSKFYTEEDRRKGLPQRALATVLAKGKFEGQGWRVRQDGSRFWAHVVLQPIHDEDGRLLGYAKITKDLTESKQQMDELTRLKETLDMALSNMSQGLCLFDAAEQLVFCNPRFYEVYGFDPRVIGNGSTLTDVLWAMHASDEVPCETTSLTVGREREQQLAGLERNGGHFFEEKFWRGKSLAVHHRALPEGGWVSTLDDITERKTIEERIVHLAHHDPLTSLPNRSCFQEAVEQTLVSRHACALLYLDLDRFKPVNDSLGHAVGDEVLRGVATRIKAQLRSDDLSARLGGDEFAILLTGEVELSSAENIAKRIVQEIDRPFQIKGFEVTVGASIGIALAPEHGKDADSLLRHADLALYAAKKNGRGRCSLYEMGMNTALLQRREMEADLRKALGRKEFVVHYQPVTDEETHNVTSVEALLRWEHPIRGRVSPVDFIPIAEEIGLMPEIGDWVLQTACEEAVRWPAHINVAVNLSTTQFRVPDLAERVTRTLNRAGLAPQRLELEITETAMITDLANTTEVLKKLRVCGVQVALDDFGTGYSSLSFLRSLPFTRIKIDRSFTQDLGVTPGAAAIIRAVTGLCESLGVATTAEGVETQQQLAILRAEGCREVQGFMICRPVAAAELRQWILEYQGSSKHGSMLLAKPA